MKLPSLNTILIVIAVVFITLYLRSCFVKTPPSEKIIRSDMKIEQLEKQRVVDSVELVRIRHEKDSAIAAADERIKNLENQKQKIVNVIKKVPVFVDNLDKQQLHSGADGF